MKTTAAVIEPRAPHAMTLMGGNYSITSADGTRLVCWCPRHQCGAVFHFEAQVWAMQMPVSFAEFLAALRTNGILVADTPDLATWIDACTAATLPRATAPGGTC